MSNSLNEQVCYIDSTFSETIMGNYLMHVCEDHREYSQSKPVRTQLWLCFPVVHRKSWPRAAAGNWRFSKAAGQTSISTVIQLLEAHTLTTHANHLMPSGCCHPPGRTPDLEAPISVPMLQTQVSVSRHFKKYSSIISISQNITSESTIPLQEGSCRPTRGPVILRMLYSSSLWVRGSLSRIHWQQKSLSLGCAMTADSNDGSAEAHTRSLKI